MIQIIPDSSQPNMKRVSDFTIEDGQYSYIAAISKHGTPYVLTKIKRGNTCSYLFMKIDGKSKVCDKRNPHKTIEEALERGYRVYSTTNHLEFLTLLKNALEKRIEIKKEEVSNAS